jgi:hypothetical protein
VGPGRRSSPTASKSRNITTTSNYEQGSPRLASLAALPQRHAPQMLDTIEGGGRRRGRECPYVVLPGRTRVAVSHECRCAPLYIRIPV